MKPLIGMDVRHLRRKSAAAARRFPMAFSCAAIATAALAVLAGPAPAGSASRAAWHVFAGAAFGFPLFVAVKTLAERKGWEAPALHVARAVAALVAAGCGLTVPDLPGTAAVLRFALLFTAFFPLMTLAPFPGRGEINGFWQYNRALLARFLYALLLTQVLAAGIGFALAGIDYLVGARAPASLYLRAWIVVTGLLGSLIFLRGVPARPEKLQTAVEYPRWLDVLTRTILIPLVALYLLILYAYAAKIVAQASWPKGGVAGYVLGFSAAGILAYLFVYPVREKVEGRLVPAFVRWFFPLLLPLTLLLFLSVGRRIADYGVTESRYFGGLAAAWLAGACVYFIAAKAKNIKAVPASLAALALLSSFGPWGVHDVAARSQAARLEQILAKNGILCAGKVRPAADPVPAQDEGEISRIVRYLAERDELGRVARWCEGGSRPRSGQDAMALMGLSYDPSRRGRDIHFMARDARSLKVAGYDYSVKLSAPLRGGNDRGEAPVDPPAGRKEGRYRLLLDGREGKLFLTEGQETVLAADIVPLFRKLRTRYREEAKTAPVQVPREQLEIAERRGFVGMKVCLSEISGTEKEGTVRIANVQGEVLVKTEP